MSIVKPHTLFKHVFIPHAGNDYKPHFFREVSVATILIASIFLLGFSAGSSFLIHKTVLGASVTASVLIDLTNESRVAYNESPLTRSPILDQAAELKAGDMSQLGYFAHNSPTGVTPWFWFKKVGYVFLYAGENLAINFTDANEVRDAWLASPLHRANLLNVKFKEIGMATVSGVYKDGPTIYVVQLFGTPAVVKAVPPVTSVATTTAPQKIVATEAQPIPSPAAHGTLALAVNPEVRGETIAAPTSTPSTLESVLTTEELAIVKDTNTTEIEPQAPVVTYSKWYERALFGGSYYVDILYKALLALVLIALITMIVIEIRKQHWKHIAYGLALLLIITLCILINQTFW